MTHFGGEFIFRVEQRLEAGWRQKTAPAAAAAAPPCCISYFLHFFTCISPDCISYFHSYISNFLSCIYYFLSCISYFPTCIFRLVAANCTSLQFLFHTFLHLYFSLLNSLFWFLWFAPDILAMYKEQQTENWQVNRQSITNKILWYWLGFWFMPFDDPSIHPLFPFVNQFRRNKKLDDDEAAGGSNKFGLQPTKSNVRRLPRESCHQPPFPP